MRAFYLSAIAFCMLLAGSCGMLGRELPEKRPDHIIIQYFDGGGMSPEGTTYYFSEDSCYAKFWLEKTTNILHFKLDKAGLDELYKAFYDHEFERIKTRQMETYDRGGISISLSFGGKTWSVEDAGSTYILEKWISSFNTVIKTIEAKVAPVVKDNTAPLVVKFDPGLQPDSLVMYFRVDQFSVTSDSTKRDNDVFLLLKGVHNYSLSLAPRRQPSYSRRIIANLDDIVSVCGMQDTLYLSLQDSIHILARKNFECTVNDK